jgi:subtilisin family serine protease
MATAGTVLLATAPAHAEFNLPMAQGDDAVPCQTVAESGEPLNKVPWAKNFIGLDDAQQYNRGTFETGGKSGDPVTIAVIDSGVEASLAEVFGSRVLDGVDHFDKNSKGKCDAYFHGTAVAAIAAGAEQGDGNFIGVAPEANILPIRIFQGNEGADVNKSVLAAYAIRDAVDNGADVINVSLVVPPSPDLADAVAYAVGRNVVVVAATGNENKNMDGSDYEEEKDKTFYPANYPEVIAVGAHNAAGNWYEKTNFGGNIDLLAPGDGLAFPFAGGEWKTDSGTSYAAPFVAGAAALLKGQYGAEATPQWIQKRLQETAIHPPNTFNIYQGHGVLNVAAALTAPVDSDEVTSTEVTEVPTEDVTSAPVAEAERDSIAGLDPDYDPLAMEKTVAWASVGGSLVLITLVLVLRKIIPKGRNRGWRPGTRKPDNLPAVKTASD